MISFIIFRIIQNIRANGWRYTFSKINACFIYYSKLKYILLLLLFVLTAVTLQSQQLEINYQIERNGEKIGWMKLSRQTNGEQCTLNLLSEITFRFFLKFSAQLKEYAQFEKGIMQLSKQFQQMNGKIKIDNLIKLEGNNYVITKNEADEIIPVSEVKLNLLCLYFKEPVDNHIVFADNFQRFLPITKTTDGGYKVLFPDGGSNCYYYQSGICYRIFINKSLYSANIILIH